MIIKNKNSLHELKLAIFLIAQFCIVLTKIERDQTKLQTRKINPAGLREKVQNLNYLNLNNE